MRAEQDTYRVRLRELDRVLDEQSRLQPQPNAPQEPGGRPITAAGARRLTEQIRSTTRLVCMLLLESYEKRAWFALGYRSWEQYVRSELGFRRSRAYQLLDHARVLRALQEAANTSEVPDISSYAAGQIKPHLDEVVALVRTRTGSMPDDSPTEIIASVVRQQRQRLARSPDSGELGHLAPLFEAIDCLAELPAGVAERTSIGAAELDRALRWLTELEETLLRPPAV